MLTEHLAPLPRSVAERVANRAANVTQKKAKEDKKKMEQLKQARRAYGEDTFDEEEEEEE
jgi:hypothetical protein